MKCEVVRDLIPLVIDDVASEESRNLVGEHLETCEACRAYRDGMAAQLEKPAPVEDDTSFIRFCRRLQKNFRWRRLALWVVVAALAASGTSVIGHPEHIDRGYAAFTEILASLGAQIRREAPLRNTSAKKTSSKKQNHLAIGTKRWYDTVI